MEPHNSTSWWSGDDSRWSTIHVVMAIYVVRDHGFTRRILILSGGSTCRGDTCSFFFFDINVFGHGLRLMLKGHAALETS